MPPRRHPLRMLVWLAAAGTLGLSDSLPWGGCAGGCPPEAKRDIFMSRGWGAGGMPFTLYYPASGGQQDQPPQPQAEFLTAARPQQPPQQQPDQSKPATLPQLFVSYGWGPLGRK